MSSCWTWDSLADDGCGGTTEGGREVDERWRLSRRCTRDYRAAQVRAGLPMLPATSIFAVERSLHLQQHEH